MSEYRYNADERETIISTHDGLKTINIYSCQRKWINAVINLANARPNDVRIIQQTEDMIEAEMPVKYLKLRAPRIVTEEQRLKAIANFKKNKCEIEDVASEDNEDVDDGLIIEAGEEVTEEKKSIYLE